MLSQSGRPDANFCFGRDILCEEIIHSVTANGAVLLFGARQAGKTTVLLKLRQLLSQLLSPLSPGLIPVYVDLMTVHPDAQPSDVFRKIATEAAIACGVELAVTGLHEIPADGQANVLSVDGLIGQLSKLLRSIARPDGRLLFLMDESKRVLAGRFPRGFQDNLFALLYGEHVLAGKIGIVFAGAQELYKFCEDDTSPIGSRAAFHLVRNLDSVATDLLVAGCVTTQRADIPMIAQEIYSITGGQAGLSVRLALRPDDLEGDNEEVLDRLRLRHSSLLRTWATSLSAEARFVQEALLESGDLRVTEIPQMLEKKGFDRYRGDRVIEELEFTGIARRENGMLLVSNQLYAAFARSHGFGRQGTPEEQTAWMLIERLELMLRVLVRTKYSQRWAADADNQISKVLGPDSWNTILQNRGKASKSYRYTAHTANADVLHYAYFGQLAQLITSKQAWDMFKGMFRDKREFDDMVIDIMPVRNDSAHFRTVPDRELLRSQLRCQDLINVLQNNGMGAL